MLITLLLVVHIIICAALMASILLQSGKGGSLAGAFGVGGASQTLFGGRGAATFLTRATQYLGAVFFATSLVLALLSRPSVNAPRSLIQKEAQRGGRPAASAPASQAPAPGAQAPASGAPAGGASPQPAPAAGGK